MSHSLPRISVLLVELGDDPLTSRALDALQKCSYAGPIECLVHRNGGDGIVAPSAHARIDRLLVSSENLGFGQATNRLAESATGDLLLLLNNDVLLSPGALERMVERQCLNAVRDTDANPRWTVVVPQFRGFHGEVLELGAYVDGLGRVWQIFRDEPLPRALAGAVFECAYGSAACMLIERRTFLELGGFDPIFGLAYYEDTDLCHRLSERGGRIVVEPRAVAFHLEGATAAAGERSRRDAAMAHGRTAFANRWRKRLAHRTPTTRAAASACALWDDIPRISAPESPGAPRRAGERSPRAIWLLPEALVANRAGGSSRIAREIETLAASGWRQIVWSEQGGDSAQVARLLAPLGVRWGSFSEPVRWAGDALPITVLDEVDELLRRSAPDLVVIWSWTLARSLLARVRNSSPGAAVVVDIGVLAYLQADRAQALALDEPAIRASRTDELAVYEAADAVIASSRLEEELLVEQLPDLPVHAYDVGAYAPRFDCLDPGAGVVYLGNFFHPPNRDAVGWWIDAIAPELARAGDRATRLRVVGTGSERLVELDPEGGHLAPRGWVEDLADELACARVFANPLRYGAGTKDKLSQAMRFGRPVVTTSIGAESMPDPLRKAMIVEDDPARFARAVHRLLVDDRHWRECAAATRRAAERAWEMQQAADREFVAWLAERTGAGGRVHGRAECPIGHRDRGEPRLDELVIVDRFGAR
ncbi:MAG: glycosyltransferase [Thermoanaerobaculia bacterium]